MTSLSFRVLYSLLKFITARFITYIMIEGIESEVIMSKRLEDENLERQAQILAQQILVRRGTKGDKRAERVALDVARKQVSLQK